MDLAESGNVYFSRFLFLNYARDERSLSTGLGDIHFLMLTRVTREGPTGSALAFFTLLQKCDLARSTEKPFSRRILPHPKTNLYLGDG